MKFSKFIPTTLFKPKKSRSHALSTSFSSSASEDGTASAVNGGTTPSSVLPTSLSSSTDMEIYQAFEMMDRDGDGKIPKEELKGLLCRLGAEPISREELNAMLNEVDRDGDGCISLQEFYDTIGGGVVAPAGDVELREAFDFFDSDGDGRITAEELFNVFRTIGAGCTLEECQRMIEGVDRSGDGFVCFTDFTRMMDPQQHLHPLQTQN